MRAHGLLEGPAGAEPADHVCWVYDEADSFGAVARRYLAEGLARGERLMYVGDRGTDPLREDAEPRLDVDGLLDRGALEILDVAAAYRRTGAMSPEAQWAFYETATRRAVADGYRGLRLVAEATPLAADPESRAALLRWEPVADEFIASGSGLSAMCAYEGGTLDDETLADLAARHPRAHCPVGNPPFRVWFDGGTVRLGGEIDAVGAPRLSRVLATVPVRPPAVVVDLSAVEFVDAAGCRAIAEWLCHLPTAVRPALRGASRLFARMWYLLGFDRVTGVEAGG